MLVLVLGVDSLDTDWLPLDVEGLPWTCVSMPNSVSRAEHEVALAGISRKTHVNTGTLPWVWIVEVVVVDMAPVGWYRGLVSGVRMLVLPFKVGLGQGEGDVTVKFSSLRMVGM